MTLSNEEQANSQERQNQHHEEALAKIVHPDLIKAHEEIYQAFKEGGIDVNQLQKQSESLLIAASSVDYMTGLDNTRSAEIKLTDLMKYCKDNNIPLVGIYFDGDDLKEINNISHTLGDKTIKAIAEALKRGSRPTDLPVRISTETPYKESAENEVSAARVGGDEFFLALPGASLEQGKMIFNRIQQIYKEITAQEIPEFPRAANGGMTLTGGAAQFIPSIDKTAEMFKSRTERAMQFGKEQNKGNFYASAENIHSN